MPSHINTLWSSRRPKRLRTLAVERLETRQLLAVTDMPIGAEFPVNTTTADDQFMPAVAADQSGDFVVVWDSIGQDGDGHGLFGRRFDSSGTPQGGEFPVNTTTEGDQLFASVSMDLAGNFVVAWEGDTEVGVHVFARRFHADGTPAGDEFEVAPTESADQLAPSVAMDAGGDFVVAWDRFSQTSDGVFARRFLADGIPAGDEFQVNTSAPGGLYLPSVASAESGRFVVVWESDDGNGNSRILGQRFDDAGQFDGSEFTVNTTAAGDQFFPAVAMDAGGDFVVAWESYGHPLGGVLARRFDADGTPSGDDFAVHQTAPTGRFRPSVAADSGGSFVVAWDSFGQDGDREGSFGRRFNAAGLPQGNEFQINTTSADDQELPAVAISTMGDRYVVVWDSYAQDGDGHGIFGQQFLVNRPPAVDLSGPIVPGRDFDTLFVEGGPAVPIVASDLEIIDDSPTLASATVTLVDAADGVDEFLWVDTSGTAIIAVYHAATGQLQMTGTDTVTAWQDVLRTLRYGNWKEDATPGPRAVKVVLHDGQSEGEASTATVGVIEAISSLSGSVYIDANNNGLKEPGEAPIAGVPIALSGVNDLQESVNLTTTTASDGSYQFGELRPGVYTLSETQPGGFLDGIESLGSLGGSIDQDRFSQIVVPPGAEGSDYDFGELSPAGLFGSVYLDTNNNGLKEPGEAPIAGVPITLTGVNDLEESINLTTTTASDGSYQFGQLRPGVYTLSETQPGGFLDGIESLGSLGGSIDHDRFSQIVVPPGAEGSGYDFGELSPAGLFGSVYLDTNNNGLQDPGEAPIAGVPIALSGVNDLQESVNLTTTTASDGSYQFGELRPGVYTLSETQPGGFLDGIESLGSLGGSIDQDRFSQIVVPPGAEGSDYDFGELSPAGLFGSVYLDTNNNGLKEPGEAPIAGVPITLTGVNDLEESINLTTTTASDGSYQFGQLRPGVYTLSETQPGGFLDGIESLGSLGGSIDHDRFSQIVVPPGGEGSGYDFGELSPAGLFGSVYLDTNNNGLQEPGEAPIAGVPIALFGVNDLQESINLTTTTASDGSYAFGELRPGVYTLSETQPGGFLDGIESLGSLGGSIDQDRFSQIVVPPGGEGTGYDFGELSPAEAKLASLSGFVYLDADNDGLREPVEVGLPNVPVTLTGVDNQGRVVDLVALTDAGGRYQFDNLAAGFYSLTETQPSAFNDGRETQGRPAMGVVQNDRFVDLALPGGTAATDYNFAERGLKAELVSKRLLLASTPPAAELVPELMVAGGSTWYDFYAPEPAVFTATVDSPADDLVIELYNDQMLPVVLSHGRQQVAVPIAGGANYSLHVAGVPKSARAPMSLRLTREDDSSAVPLETAALEIRVAATDLAGTPISSVVVGGDLLLEVRVEDMRDVPLGVFSAYLDVFYDPGLLSISGPITFGDDFPNGRSADTTVAGQIDEAGAFAGFTALGSGEFLLFRVPMHADAAGIVTLDGQPAGLSPDHDPLLSDVGGPTLAEDVFYGSVSLEIVPPVIAVDDLFIVAAGSSGNVLDVLANDLPGPGVAATIEGVVSTGVGGVIGRPPGDHQLTYTPPGGFTGAEHFTYTATDGNGFIDQATVTVAVPESLGIVDFVELPDLNPKAAEIWYKLQPAHDAILTVEAVVDDQAGSAELTLFDALGETLAHSTLVAGRPRLDRPALAGTTYFLRVAGTTRDTDLHIANLVTHAGTAVIVQGTAGGDTMEFDASASRVVTINGVRYPFADAEVTSVEFDGGPGADQAVFRGGDQDEMGVFYPDHGTFQGGTPGQPGAFFVNVAGVASITAYGGGGTDAVYLYDSPGDDTFVASPFYGKLSGPGFVQEAFGFALNYGYATAKNGGRDTAVLEDSPLKDKFKLDWPKAGQFFGKMYRGDYFNRAKMFEVIQATSTGGDDLARLFGSDGNDTFEGRKGTSRMLGPGFDVTLHDYHTVTAYAQSGFDVARLSDTAGDDTLRARGHKTEIYDTPTKGKDYKITARRFDDVFARADTPGDDYDVAKLHDTLGEDLLEATADWTRMSRKESNGSLDLLYEVLSFERVKGYSLLGGADRAILHDTPGDDLLEARFEYADSLGQDDSWAGLSAKEGAAFRLLYDVIAFDRVEATSSTGRNTTDVAAEVDFLMLDDGWET
jgi:hypothetical protein